MTDRKPAAALDRRAVLKLSAAFGLAPLGPLAARTQVAGYYRTGVGDAVVTALLDGFIELNPADLNGADATTKARLLAENALADGPVDSAINAYVIETGGTTVVVDSGAGGAFGPTAGRFAEALAAAGVDPAAVDVYFLTHMHPDHVNGGVSGGSALFPNAELALHDAEPAFWGDEQRFAGAPEMMRNFAQMARDGIAPYAERMRTLSDGATVAPGVSLMHLPGHTPGHSGLLVESGGERLLLWADIVHLGPIQFARPDVTIPFDVDEPQAAATRRRVMDMAASEDLEIGGSHVVFPSFGRLEAQGGGYAFHPSRWDYRV